MPRKHLDVASSIGFVSLRNLKPACPSPAPMRQVLLLLGACPFPDRLDVRWFSTTLAGLGTRFHRHAVRAALSTPRSADRTAVILAIISGGEVAPSVVLDELRPQSATTADAPGEYSLANQVCSTGLTSGFDV